MRTAATLYGGVLPPFVMVRTINDRRATNAKYVNGLRYTSQEHVALHNVFFVDDADKKANKDRKCYKAELHLSDINC